MVEVVIGYKIDGRAQISKKTFRLLKFRTLDLDREFCGLLPTVLA
jgi:hypothetical protein